jgi:hypothetical protein
MPGQAKDPTQGECVTWCGLPFYNVAEVGITGPKVDLIWWISISGAAIFTKYQTWRFELDRLVKTFIYYLVKILPLVTFCQKHQYLPLEILFHRKLDSVQKQVYSCALSQYAHNSCENKKEILWKQIPNSHDS